MKEFTNLLSETCARHKKFIVVFVSMVLALCVVGMIIATFVDLRLSEALNNPTQWFSKLLHNYGEWPAYLINVGFPVALCVWLIKHKKYFWAILPFVFTVVFGFLFSMMWFKSTSMPFVFNAIFNAVCTGALFGLFFAIPKEFHRKVLYILGVAFVISNIVYLVMLATKYLWGRVRFFDLMDDFTPWYRPNGINGHESFPSGHVLSAVSLLMFWLVPIIFKIKNIFARLPFIIVPVLYTLAMMYARIVVGAHYLSDVVFSIILFTVCTVVFLWIMCNRPAPETT